MCPRSSSLDDPNSFNRVLGLNVLWETGISDFSESNLKSFDEPLSITWNDNHGYDSDSDMGYSSEDESEGALVITIYFKDWSNIESSQKWMLSSWIEPIVCRTTVVLRLDESGKSWSYI